jgi:arylsulfatase A-like enzyme
MLAHLAIAALARAGASGPQEQPPHHIVIVILDDVGVDGLVSFLGLLSPQLDRAATPVIDSLLLKGVKFTEAWATPWCSSTRCEILSGRW